MTTIWHPGYVTEKISWRKNSWARDHLYLYDGRMLVELEEVLGWGPNMLKLTELWRVESCPRRNESVIFKKCTRPEFMMNFVDMFTKTWMSFKQRTRVVDGFEHLKISCFALWRILKECQQWRTNRWPVRDTVVAWVKLVQQGKGYVQDVESIGLDGVGTSKHESPVWFLAWCAWWWYF